MKRSRWSKGLPTNTSKGSNGVISVWLVITEKQLEDRGTKVKAPLGARGFEDPDLGNFAKSSPMCGRGSWRMVCIIACMKSWRPGTIDITTAFLH